MYHLSLCEIKESLLKREFSSVELTKCFLERIEKYKNLNAYITVCADKALQSAKKSDEKIANNTAGDLEGIPLGIKDIFVTKGIRTTCASKMLENFIPPYESTITQKLSDAGAVFLGKTNMDEFAMGSTNSTSYFGKVINPWKVKERLVPGGSSGGSAAAVAGHLCAAATGSDTGGSIRQPAAFTGIVGLKPTYGRCSRYGMIAMASSLDQGGVFTKTVKDAAVFLKAMSGYDVKDSTSANIPVPDFESFAGKSIKGMKIGIPKEFLVDGIQQDIVDAWKKGTQILKDAGAEIVDVSLPSSKYSLPAYYIIQPAESSANLARYDGVRYGFRAEGKTLNEMYENTRDQGFGDEVKRRILIGTYVLSAGYFDAYYMKALKVRKIIHHEFNDVFQKVDALLAPTTPSSAFSLDNEPKDPVTMYLNDVLTVTANIVGIPGMSVPICLDRDQKPLGLQLLVPHFMEEKLIQLGSILEAGANFPSLKEID